MAVTRATPLQVLFRSPVLYREWPAGPHSIYVYIYDQVPLQSKQMSDSELSDAPSSSAPPPDAVLERSLRGEVEKKFKANERDQLTVNAIRTLSEQSLGLREGFYTAHESWKAKSKNIIKGEVVGNRLSRLDCYRKLAEALTMTCVGSARCCPELSCFPPSPGATEAFIA